jgi:hypothetical protein
MRRELSIAIYIHIACRSAALHYVYSGNSLCVCSVQLIHLSTIEQKDTLLDGLLNLPALWSGDVAGKPPLPPPAASVLAYQLMSNFDQPFEP